MAVEAALEEMTRRGFKVSSIGSPIGKVRLDEAYEEHLEAFRRAVQVAKKFGAPFIRLFSYYPAGARFVEGDREEVIRRLRGQAEIADENHVTLLHENESGIYGETGQRCADLMEAVGHPHFKAAFDFANFVHAGEDTLACWRLLKRHAAYFHIKDYDGEKKEVVPAGQGDGKIREILSDALASGYEGFLCFEPHLSVVGQFGGFTGPDRFGRAVGALKGILDQLGAEYA